MSKWKLDTYKGVKVWYSEDVIKRIKDIAWNEICEDCPNPCLDKMVESCGYKKILVLIKKEDE